MAGALVTTNILATAVSMGLATLREELALCMIANRDREGELVGAKKNGTVNITIPAAVATRAVSPDVVPPSVTAVTPTVQALTLDTWREAPFIMDDKGMSQVDKGIIPMQANEAIKGLANYIEDYLWTKITARAYGWSGTAGTTPFAVDTSAYLEGRKVANNQLMPMDPRYVVLGTDAEANALGLRAFQDASFGGGEGVIINGQIGRKLGALWIMSQRVPTHTGGTYTTGTTVTGVNAIGATVIALSGGATGTLIAGDIIGIGAYTYNVVSSVGTTTPSSVTITPGLFAATAGAEAIVGRKSGANTFVQNLIIQRDGLAFAMAPLIDAVVVPGATLQAVAVDEKTGLALRIEVSRQHKQVQWSFDALFGGAVVRDTSLVYIGG